MKVNVILPLATRKQYTVNLEKSHHILLKCFQQLSRKKLSTTARIMII